MMRLSAPRREFSELPLVPEAQHVSGGRPDPGSACPDIAHGQPAPARPIDASAEVRWKEAHRPSPSDSCLLGVPYPATSRHNADVVLLDSGARGALLGL